MTPTTPIPNADLLALQHVIRERLQKPIDVMIDGTPTTMRLIEYYRYLERRWHAAKQDWDAAQRAECKRLSDLHGRDQYAAREAYLAWYEANAGDRIAVIDARHQELARCFPIEEWEAALSLLDATDERPASPTPGEDFRPTPTAPPDWKPG